MIKTATAVRAATCNRAMWRKDSDVNPPHLRCTIKFERCPVQDGGECLVKNNGG